MATVDLKLFQKVLPDEPTESDYLYWKKMLITYIAKAAVPNEHKLDVLFSQCGTKTFSLVEDSTSFNDAITFLDAKFLKRTSSIMQPHKLRTRKRT